MKMYSKRNNNRFQKIEYLKSVRNTLKYSQITVHSGILLERGQILFIGDTNLK